MDRVHGGYVHARRVRVLSTMIADLLPQQAHVLDVGCGDGYLSRLIMNKRPELRVQGIDVLVRPGAHIPVLPFNGKVVPFDTASFDVVLFVDVLHHTNDPMVLLREAARVARQLVVIKDHNRNGLLAGPTLRFMDWIGNARHGVALPYNYWTRTQWKDAIDTLGLKPATNITALSLYPPSVDWIFGRHLHFLASLEKTFPPERAP